MKKPSPKKRLSRFVPDESAFPNLIIRDRDWEIIQTINEYRYLDFDLIWRLMSAKYSQKVVEYNKGKDGVDKVMHWLKNDGYDIHYEAWINKYHYEECLEQRKPFDVVIDNLTQGFIGMVGL